jgi:hypothetical protein
MITGTWMWIQKLLIRTGGKLPIAGNMNFGSTIALQRPTNARKEPERRNQRRLKYASNARPKTKAAPETKTIDSKKVPISARPLSHVRS